MNNFRPATVKLPDMTRLRYSGLLGGTALVGFGVGKLCQREPVRPAPVARPEPMPVPVVQVQKVDTSKLEGHTLFAEVKATESSAEFAKLWKRLDSSRLPSGIRSLLKDWLLSRWVIKDLAGCLAHCNSVPNRVVSGVPWVGEALAAWAKIDISSALARAQQIDSAYPVELRMQVDHLSWRIAEIDPAGFLSNKYHLPKSMVRDASTLALETIGRRNPQEAVVFASRYQTEARSGASLGAAASVISTAAAQQMGDAAALDWARSLRDLPAADRAELESGILNYMAATNPTRALAEAEQWDWEKRGILPSELWPLLAKKNPLQALQLASEKEPASLRYLAQTIAPDAMTLAQTLASANSGVNEEGSISQRTLQETLATLPAGRCRGLLDQAMALAPGAVREQIYDAALRGLATQRPEEAAALALSLPEGNERQGSCLAVVETLGKSIGSDPSLVPSVMTLIELALPANLESGVASDRRIAACQDALMQVARQAPEQVWSWLQQQSDASRYDTWIPKVLGGMALRQPEQAVAQALKMPTPELRQEAIGETIHQWTTYDPHAASVWAKTLPSGQERATAALRLAQGIAEVEPELALPWAMESAPGEDRQRVLTQIFRQWEEDDPGAAAKALQQSYADEALLEDIQSAWKGAHP